MLKILSIILSLTLIQKIKPSDAGIIITNITFQKPFCNPKDQILTLTLYCYNCDSSLSISSSTDFYIKDTNQNLIKCTFENSIDKKTPFKMNCTITKPHEEISQVSFSNGVLNEYDEEGNSLSTKKLRKILLQINENIESISSCNSACNNAKDVKDSKSCVELKTSNKIYFPHCCYLKYQKNGSYKKSCVEISENQYKEIDDYIEELKTEICESEEEEKEDKNNDDDNTDDDNTDDGNNNQGNNNQGNNNQGNNNNQENDKQENNNQEKDTSKKNKKKKKCVISTVNCNSGFLNNDFISIFSLFFILLF